MKDLKIRTKEPIGRKALLNPGSRNCTLGISLNKPYFSKANVEKYMRFGLSNFENMLVWVADSPERWNYVATQGMSLEEATNKALELGQEEVRKFTKVKNKLGNEGRGKLEVTCFSSLAEDNYSYENVLDSINKEYKDNPVFNEDVKRWIMNTIGFKFKQLTGNKLERAIETSANYLKEETAMMFHLAEKDPRRFIDLYPAPYNSLICLKGMNNGRYPELWNRLGFEEGYGYVDVFAEQPLIDKFGMYVGKILGKTPKERRDYEAITKEIICASKGFATLAAGMMFWFAPAVYFEAATTVKKECLMINGREYTAKHRTNGKIEVFSRYLGGSRAWIDEDGDGDIDAIRISGGGRLPTIFIRDEKKLNGVNEMYKKRSGC